MSTSSTDVALTVVVASNGAPGSVERFLDDVGPQCGSDDEVIACEPVASADEVRRRFPDVRFLERRGALVPELWRDGIDEARGEVVLLTISPMLPAPDWIATARRLSREAEAIGGAIDPASGLRVRDWAEYFCRYARDMRPFEPHACADLPGDNAAYRLAALDPVRDQYRDGFWEPVVHRALLERSNRLRHDPALLVEQGRSAGVAAFARQRRRHGRLYGHQRGERFGTARNVVGVVGSPLVPFLMTFRVVRQVAAKRRHRLAALLALPLIFYFNAVWALAEARGHADMVRRRG
jgi:hypothetical protein